MTEELKPVEDLSVEECLLQLKQLKKEVDFGVTWTKDTPLEELKALVTEGRRVLTSDEEEESKDDEDADADKKEDTEDGPEKKEDAPDEKNPDKIEVGENSTDAPIHVIVTNGENRTYTRASHGSHYRTLAKQYAENVKGTLVKGK